MYAFYLGSAFYELVSMCFCRGVIVVGDFNLGDVIFSMGKLENVLQAFMPESLPEKLVELWILKLNEMGGFPWMRIVRPRLGKRKLNLLSLFEDI